MPVPLGTLPTILPFGAKLAKLFSLIKLLYTRTNPPFFWIKSGKSKTKIPPVFPSATLLYTSAYNEFSISMPATFWKAVQLRTVMYLDCPT